MRMIKRVKESTPEGRSQFENQSSCDINLTLKAFRLKHNKVNEPPTFTLVVYAVRCKLLATFQQK